MDFLKNLFNPDPSFEGQCIIGTSSVPLIAARIHPKDGRSYLAWRAAEVVCGFALDGGAQQLIKQLADYSGQKRIFVDPVVYRHKDLMGALQAVAPDFAFVSTDEETPCEGCIHVVVPSPNTPIVQRYKASPTVTALGQAIGAAPVSQVVPTSGTAAQVAAQITRATPQQDSGLFAPETSDYPQDTLTEAQRNRLLFENAVDGGARRRTRSKKRKSGAKRSLKKLKRMQF
jgi:hypothetical protein